MNFRTASFSHIPTPAKTNAHITAILYCGMPGRNPVSDTKLAAFGPAAVLYDRENKSEFL